MHETFCNMHILTHFKSKICSVCNKDTCLEMMWGASDKCFVCSAKLQFDKIAYVFENIGSC